MEDEATEEASEPVVAQFTILQDMNGDWVLSAWDCDGVQVNQCHLPDTDPSCSWTLMYMGGSNDPLHTHAWAGGSLAPINCHQYMLDNAAAASAPVVKPPPPVRAKQTMTTPPVKKKNPPVTPVTSPKVSSVKPALAGVSANPTILRGMKATGPVPTLAAQGTQVFPPKKGTGKAPKTAQVATGSKLMKRPAAAAVVAIGSEAPPGDCAISLFNFEVCIVATVIVFIVF